MGEMVVTVIMADERIVGGRIGVETTRERHNPAQRSKREPRSMTDGEREPSPAGGGGAVDDRAISGRCDGSNISEIIISIFQLRVSSAEPVTPTRCRTSTAV